MLVMNCYILILAVSFQSDLLPRAPSDRHPFPDQPVDIKGFPQLPAEVLDSRVIQIPPGNWYVPNPIRLQSKTLTGSGPYISSLWVGGDYPAIIISAHPRSRRHMDAIYDGLSEMGASVSGISIHGNNKGTGIETDGPCDEIRVTDVTCTNLQYGLLIGNCCRESWFSRCSWTNCDTSVFARQVNGPPTDGTNNLYFDSCKSLYARKVAIRISNESNDETIRTIRWSGGLIHGRVRNNRPESVQWSPSSLVEISGRCQLCVFDSHWVGPDGIDGMVAPVRLIGNSTLMDFRGTWVRAKGTKFVDGEEKSTWTLSDSLK